MGRSPKMGLDYFPLQTDVGSDPKIKKLIRRGGKDAWVVFSWMLVLIYHEGYFSDADTIKESITWDFRDIDEDVVENCFTLMADLNLINKELFETERIITSRGIQRQYVSSTKRRNEINTDNYWLLNACNNPISVDRNVVSVNNNPISVCEGTQKEKEKERENKRKEKETKTDVGGAACSRSRRLPNRPQKDCPKCHGDGYIPQEDGPSVKCDCWERKVSEEDVVGY